MKSQHEGPIECLPRRENLLVVDLPESGGSKVRIKVRGCQDLEEVSRDGRE